MLDSSRLDSMRQDLHRAAATIQKLKKERDEYRFSYEVLKEESVSKKDLMRNQSFIDSLRDSNDLLQKEIKKLRKDNEHKDRTIAGLEDKLLQAKQSFKTHQKSLKEIEDARKELNFEITNTRYKPSTFQKSNDLMGLTRNLLTSLKQNPSIYSIFKQTTRCGKKFYSLIDSEHYAKAYEYLCRFIVELLASFKFTEDNQSFCSSDELDTWQARSYKDQLKESNEQQSMRLKMLKKKLQDTQHELRIENEGLGSVKSHKKMMSCDYNSLRPAKSLIKPPHLKELDEKSAKEGGLLTQSSNRAFARNSSKSPLRIPGSPRSRFEQFQVPFRRVQASASVAECLGNKSGTRNK